MTRKLMAILMALVLALTSFAALAEGTAATEETVEPGWVNILLLGGDSRSLTNYGRTDSMIIVSVNREESLVKMTSIMRDTWVAIPGKGTHKINAANVFGGPELAVRTVSEAFDVEIDDYVLINMVNMANIIDLVGGVEVEITAGEAKRINEHAAGFVSEMNMEGYDQEISVEGEGLQLLNGVEAITYSRNRSDSDYYRVMRQQKVLLALAERVQNMEIDALMEIMDEVLNNMSTSLTEEELKDFAMAGMVMEVADVQHFRLPANGTFEDGTFDGVWCIKPDFEKNAKMLNNFIYNGVDYKVPEEPVKEVAEEEAAE